MNEEMSLGDVVRAGRWHFLYGLLVGPLFMILVGTYTGTPRWILVGILVLNGALCSPFRLDNYGGRVWWAAYGGLIACALILVNAGLSNPIGWGCVILAAPLAGLATTLRWNSPVTRRS